MLENSQDQHRPCVVCNQHHEEMLMLSCLHDPCINCAANQYVENEHQKQDQYTCAHCGENTDLDHSTVIELQRVYYKTKNRKKIDNRPKIQESSASLRDQTYGSRPKKILEMAQGPRRNYGQSNSHLGYPPIFTPPVQPISQPSYSSNPKKSYQPQMTYLCADHQEEELNYFCFTCYRPICPECAIHGFHKDHQMQTTRKAIKQIKILLNEDKQKIEAEANGLISSREKKKKLIRQLGDQNKKDQEYLKKKINQLRNVINQKEKELSQVIHGTYDRNCEVLRAQGAVVEKMLDDISICKKAIDATIKKQDLNILQEFNRRHDEVNQTLERSEREKEKKYQSQIKNPQKIIDLSIFQDDLDQLLAGINSIKFETTLDKD